MKQQKQGFRLDESHKAEDETTNLKFQDPYLVGFGMLLFYDMKEAPSEFPSLKTNGSQKTIKCFYLYTRDNSTHEMDADSLVRNRACLAVDADEAGHGSKSSVNPNFSFHSTENLSTNSKSDELHKSCNKW